MSVATSHAILHNVLCALAWATPESTAAERYDKASTPSPYNSAPKTIATYWKDEIERTFQLNKDPDSIDSLVNTMKTDFSANAGTDTISPNRIIFFNGGKQFYKDRSKQSTEYWLTGWKQGEMPDPLQMVAGNGMTYCESFEVRQGDFNPSHDPFDEEGTCGEFAWMNRQLWADQPADYDKHMLTIYCQDKDANSIRPISFDKAVDFSGLWTNYKRCIDTGGKLDNQNPDDPAWNQSRWTEEWGGRLFPGAVTYKDAMKQIGDQWYNDQVQKMSKNARFLEQVRNADASQALGFGLSVAGITEDQAMDIEQPQSARVARRDPDDDDDRTSYTFGRKGKGKRRHNDEDEEEKDEAPKKRSSAPSSAFFRYLESQSNGSKRLLHMAREIVEQARASNPQGYDNDAVAWQGLSSQIVGNQLVAASAQLANAGESHKYPPTTLEKYLSKLEQWDGKSDVDLLFEKDSESFGWASIHEHTVWLYLSPSMKVQDEVVYASAPFTLSAKHTALFAISHDLLNDLIASDGVLKIDSPDKSSAFNTYGAGRLAHLQHSVNVSTAFEALKEHLAANRDERKLLLLTGALDGAMLGLTATLKKVINVSNVPTGAAVVKGFTSKKLLEYLKTASKLPALPCQSGLAGAVKALNKLVGYFYDTPKSEWKDEQIIKHCHGVIHWLANPQGHATPDNTEGGEASTSARVYSAGLSRPYRKDEEPITAQEKAKIQKLIDEGKVFVDGYVKKAESKWTSTKSSTQFGLMSIYVVAMEMDDLIPLWQYYKYNVGADPTTLEHAIKTVIELYGKLMVQSLTRLGGFTPVQLFRIWYLRQFSIIRNAEELRIEINLIKEDLVRFNANPSEDKKIDFSGASTLSAAIQTADELRRDQQSDLAAWRHSAHVVIDWSKISSPASGGAGRRSHKLYLPAGSAGKYKDEGTRAEIYDILQDIKHSPKDTADQDHYWRQRNGNWRTRYSPRVAAIGVQYLYRFNSVSLAIDDTLVSYIQPYLTEAVNERWNDPNVPLSDEVEVEIPDMGYSNATRRAEDEIQQLLGGVSLHDCRLFDIMVKNHIEPFIGFLYMWPWIRFLGSQVVMVRDGLGQVKYMPPDCLLSENGQQKLIYFHMSMYFKAMILNYRHIMRAPFVYCKMYLGGGGHKMWNPHDSDHTQMAKNPGQMSTIQAIPDMFAIPTRIDREVKADYMSGTGTFHGSVKLSKADQRTTEYELQDVVCRTYDFNVERQPQRNEDPLDRMDHSPFDNMLLCQAHQQAYNLTKKEYCNVIEGVGHFGRNIYNGSMDVFNNGKAFIDKKKVGCNFQVTA